MCFLLPASCPCDLEEAAVGTWLAACWVPRLDKPVRGRACWGREPLYWESTFLACKEERNVKGFGSAAYPASGVQLRYVSSIVSPTIGPNNS